MASRLIASSFLHFIAAAALFWLSSNPADANQIHLRLQPFEESIEAQKVEILLTLTELDSAAEKREERIQFGIPGTATIDLSPGRWRIEAATDGFWLPTQTLELKEAESQALELRAWPLTELVGKLVPLHGASIPAEMSLRFSSAAEDLEHVEEFEGALDCQIDETTVRCPVPADAMDLKLLPEGFIPHYRWAVTPKKGEILDLGPLALEQGASVSGWVTTESGADLPRPTRVSLVPRGLEDRERPREKARLELFTKGVEVLPIGFFQLRSLPPGTYLLNAEAQGHAMASIDISVLEGRESMLIHPLVLSPPVTLEVVVDPPVDPDGEPWLLQVGRLNRYKSSLLDIDVSPVETNGVWERTGLSPGPHLIQLLQASQEPLLVREILLGEEPMPIILEPSLIKVRGRLQLGGEPLAGTIWFGGRRGAPRVETFSSEEGEYEALLPRTGFWRIDIDADEPPVSRQLVAVEVPEPRGGEAVELDLELPKTLLRGRVVEEDGQPVGRGVVLVATDEEKGGTSTYRAIDEEGRFEFHGLPEGRVDFHARAPSGRSDHVSLVLAEDLEPPEQELVIRAENPLEVLALADGQPVPGARVMLRSTTLLHAGASVETTGPDGRVTINLPRATREVVAIFGAPGFALAIARKPISGKELVLELSRTAGTLVLELPGNAHDEGKTWFSAVFHHGADLHYSWLTSWMALHPEESVSPNPDHMRIPMLEPGDYALCRVPHAEIVEWLYTGPKPTACDIATLAPGAVMTLKLPD